MATVLYAIFLFGLELIKKKKRMYISQLIFASLRSLFSGTITYNTCDFLKMCTVGLIINLPVKELNAYRAGQLNAVKFLIEGKHCDVQLCDKDGCGPLHWCCG